MGRLKGPQLTMVGFQCLSTLLYQSYILEVASVNSG